jgi:prepilin-type N-terminal cleavage/methylation domain-containing protein
MNAMKTGFQMTNDKCRIQRRPRSASFPFVIRHSSFAVGGFTLVELLVVISIIGVLAAFTFPVMTAVKKYQFITHTRAEMGQLEAAIEGYKDAYGFYPPDNPGNALTNQLFYELIGTTNTSSSPMTFRTLDGSSTVTGSASGIAPFGSGVSAFVNCSKPGAGEQVPAGRNFIHELRPSQTKDFNGVTLLVASVGGPDANYAPLGTSGLNPWRYNSSNPTNNPGSYELYVQLQIKGKTDLVCNWNNQAQVNNPLP